MLHQIELITDVWSLFAIVINIIIVLHKENINKLKNMNYEKRLFIVYD